jgi:hypothetical protein
MQGKNIIARNVLGKKPKNGRYFYARFARAIHAWGAFGNLEQSVSENSIKSPRNNYNCWGTGVGDLICP